MEVMSYRTQEDLRSSRLQAHFQHISLKEGRDLVTQLQWEKKNFRLKMLRQKRTIARLRKKVSDQDKLIEDLERQTTELGRKVRISAGRITPSSVTMRTS